MPESSDEYFVCFVDILGYKELVKNFKPRSLGETSLMERLEGIIEDTIGRQDLVINSYDTHIDWFSDSLIISIKKEDENRIELQDLVKFLSYFQAACLSRRILVRGGVSMGSHHSKQVPHGQILISEGLIKAVSIEKSAVSPRILFDRDVITHLLDEHPGPFSGVGIVTEEAECFVDLAQGIFYFVGNDREKLIPWLNDLKIFVARSIEENVKEPKIQQKYEWLEDYFYWRFDNMPLLKGIFEPATLDMPKDRFKDFFVAMNHAKGFK